MLLETRLSRSGEKLLCGRKRCSGALGAYLEERGWVFAYKARPDHNEIWRVKDRKRMSEGRSRLGADMIDDIRAECPRCGFINVVKVPEAKSIEA